MTTEAHAQGERTLIWDRRSGKFIEKATAPARTAGRFVKGPISLDWITRASHQPGKALAVGMAIWYLAGLTRSTTVKLSNEFVWQFGVERDAKRRALLVLEKAKLIAVLRQNNRSPVVTVLAGN